MQKTNIRTSNLTKRQKVAHSGYFLKLFINISVFGFIHFDEGLDFKGWENLVEFLVIVIPNLAFDSHPGVIFVLIGVSCSQQSKNS